MIPKKLFLPTSTLNFNNIMSSESISPASFYARRGFGYKRFEKVEPNPLENLLLLYEKYPLFDIHDSEFENYPLVIEIDTDYLSKEVEIKTINEGLLLLKKLCTLPLLPLYFILEMLKKDVQLFQKQNLV